MDDTDLIQFRKHYVKGNCLEWGRVYDFEGVLTKITKTLIHIGKTTYKRRTLDISAVKIGRRWFYAKPKGNDNEEIQD